MKGSRPTLPTIIFLLALTILNIPIPTHAVTGLVCITDTFTTGCPASTPTISQSVGSQLTIAIQIQGSDPLNGFNIQITTDHNILHAVNASISGSILGSTATVSLKCLDGTIYTGAHCDPSDGLGTIHYAATRIGSNVPGDGLLFTAVYNVTALSGNTNLSLTMVTISNGTLNPDSETTLNATFQNLTDYHITADPPTILSGPSVNGQTILNFSSSGSYSDFVTIDLAPSIGLTASTADSGVFIPPDSWVTTTLNASATTAGTYSVIVTATPSDPAFTHSITVTVTVTPFTLTATVSNNLQFAGGLPSVGQSVFDTISVTVTNYQATSALARALVSMSNTTIISLGVQTATVAANGGTFTFNFQWNTTGVTPAWWNLNATATVGGTPYKKVLTNKAVRIIAWGDVDQNGAVTITDLSVIYFNYGFTPATPSRWNPYADINNNGMIDIIDVGIVTKNFGIRT